MAFSVSPGVNVSEIDTTTIVPATSTTEGALAGVFRWGPIGQPIQVENESLLASRFGKPTNFNAEGWFVGADFLSYGNKLIVSRAANTTDATGVTGVLSAIANTGAVDLVTALIKNADDFEFKQATLDTDLQYVARYPGALGNSLKISQCESAAQFTSTVPSTAIFPANGSINVASSSISVNPGDRFAEIKILAANSTIVDTVVGGYANSSLNAVANAVTVGDLLNINGQYLKVASLGTVVTTSTSNGFVSTYRVNFADAYTQSVAANVQSVDRFWEFYNVVDTAPGQSDFVAGFGNTAAQDELHVVVVDAGGEFSGVPGTALEVYQGLSRAQNAKAADGSNLYYKNVINDKSPYVWVASDRPGSLSNTALLVASANNARPLTQRFVGGSDGADESTVPLAALVDAYNVFADAEQVDVSLIMAGKAVGGVGGEGIAKHIKDNIAEGRKDVVVTISPPREAVVNNVGSEATDIVAFRSAVGSSSYITFDSGYKYRYDKYNDVYRYVPLNGDIAGLMVRTDETRDPWFSPAGFNRGQIKNVIKLAYNPSKGDRDYLYKNSVNPVVTFPGEGTFLYGDKTGLTKPSAFDRINVRRLFIVLEKAIARASKYSLFEFNDEFTRAQFRSLVEPFLRDVQGRRGIYDWRVVCDETNNTAQIIDEAKFVGDIYIKPARSINFIQLNFVAVRSGVEFSEIVGQF